MSVVVVLVAGDRLRAAEAEGGGRVGIVRHQAAAQAVDRRGGRLGHKGGLARRIRGQRVGGEIVIEGYVLLKDHYQIPDGRGGGLGSGGGAGQDDENKVTFLHL